LNFGSGRQSLFSTGFFTPASEAIVARIASFWHQKDMNALLEAPAHEPEAVDLRRDDAGVAGKANRISLNPGSPAPLWLKARAQTIGFRHGDLERTHWRKVWRAMFEVDTAASEAGFMNFTVG
jgi:hypothetical protein